MSEEFPKDGCFCHFCEGSRKAQREAADRAYVEACRELVESLGRPDSFAGAAGEKARALMEKHGRKP